MTKSEIRIFAHKQTLGTGKATAKYAGDTVNYIKVHFNLDENWDGYDSIRAVWANKATISTLLDSNNDCVIPFEVLANKGDVMVNLVASKVENGEVTDRFTSYPFVACSITADVVLNGSETVPITPSQFEQFVEVVKEDADRAEASADDAEQSASESASSASASAESASASANSASQASGYAQEAEISAERAETAKEDAETARDEILGMRATANTLPAGSDATASYNDGLLTLGIPRGEKGAKGDQGHVGATPNITIGTVETLEPNESATVTITGTDADPVLNFGIPQGEKGNDGEVTMEMLGQLLPTDTASGAIASFPDGTNLLPAISVLDSIEPIQDLNGYDKPWAGGSGANKWDEEWEVGAISVTTGENEADSTRIRTKDFIPVIGGQTYYVVGARISWYEYDANKAFLRVGNSGSFVGANEAFTVSADASYIRFKTATSYGTTYNHDIAINYPSTVTTYSPYSNICPISGRTSVDTIVSPTTSASDGQTYTTSLGRTVYGGTLNVVSGVLTVDRAMATLSELTWIKNVGSYQTFRAQPSEAMATGTSIALVQCSTWEGRSQDLISQNDDGYVWGSSADGTIRIKSTAHADMTANKFKATFADTPFVFKLATPQTYQLTPQEVDLLKGQNNLWCDSGEIEVRYNADIQKYIEKKMG